MPDIEQTDVDVSTRRPVVISNFSQYVPPFDVVRITRRMLRSVPPEYLVGLDSVVLTSTDSLSRKRLRSTAKSRKRKIKIANTRGLYHPQWNGGAAWIEVFVDRTLERWAKGLWLRIPIIRDMALSHVLFHEVGHHIHATTRPEFREREDVAESWRKKLEPRYFMRQYWWLRVLGYAVRPTLPLLRKVSTNHLKAKRGQAAS